MTPGLLRRSWIRYLAAWAMMPLLFFTLARNILVSYALPVLPALALLTAHVVRSAGFHLRGRALALVAACVPVGAAIGLAFIHLQPDSPLVPSQARLVALWQTSRSPDDLLFYFWEKPYSADFYSRGQAKLVTAGAPVTDLLKPGSFLAIAPHDINGLDPAVRSAATVVGTRSDMILLRIPPRLSSARSPE
jgi:4-amino-4-deoxy-L-arabinose transferase-like glycosyltransferase